MIIQITEENIDEMSECVESMLKTGGKLMSCIERLKEDGGESRSYGRRMSRRMPIGRREEDYDRDGDYDEMMGNRRSRDAYGRYM